MVLGNRQKNDEQQNPGKEIRRDQIENTKTDITQDLELRKCANFI